MLSVYSFTFNPFQENTYIVAAPNNDCIIIDPGCFNSSEQKQLEDYIVNKGFNPVLLFNTHCHIDHVFGNDFVKFRWNIPFKAHKDDVYLLTALPVVAENYGLGKHSSPLPDAFVNEGDAIELDGVKMELLHVPGHSPGSLCLVNHADKWIIGGDVLFRSSIGRTDLPGGDHQTLLDGIKNKLFVLPDDFSVFSGHGPVTSIGFEKKYNPFLS